MRVKKPIVEKIKKRMEERYYLRTGSFRGSSLKISPPVYINMQKKNTKYIPNKK